MIHQFKELDNVPLFFDEETERIFFKEFMKEEYKIIIHNGYLARKPKNSTLILLEKIEYFHRFIMQVELRKIPFLERKEFHIHHKDGNKLNNKKENLTLMKDTEHFSYHENQRYENAYSTWRNKVYGEFWEGDYHEEFNEWLEQKKEEQYYVD